MIIICFFCEGKQAAGGVWQRKKGKLQRDREETRRAGEKRNREEHARRALHGALGRRHQTHFDVELFTQLLEFCVYAHCVTGHAACGVCAWRAGRLRRSGRGGVVPGPSTTGTTGLPTSLRPIMPAATACVKAGTSTG